MSKRRPLVVPKPRLDIVPLRALKGVARVLTFGLSKRGHAAYVDDSRGPEDFIGKCQRHLAALQTLGGEFTPDTLSTPDAESGLPELDHAISNLLMLRAKLIEAGVLPEDPGE